MKKDGIRESAKTLYDDTLYSEKALFWLATQWRRAHYALGIPSTICSVLAGAALIKHYPVAAAILTTVAAVLTALLTFLDPKRKFEHYHACGVKFGILRGKIERFKDIDLHGKFDEEYARTELETLAKDKGELQKISPHTGGIAYFFAKRSIAHGQHQSDAAHPD
jgi:hypothetical protein